MGLPPLGWPLARVGGLRERGNAVNGTNHSDPTAVSITTIRNVLYLGMHNDVSFLLADEMSLYEQQSTYSPNMPLRMMQYVGQLYEKYVKEHRLNKYGRKTLELPTPRLATFYNGADDAPDEDTLLPGSSFPQGAQADIEVIVHSCNVSPGKSPSLLERCLAKL